MVTLTPFDPKVHAGLLEQWLNRQHVRDSWGDPAAILESIMTMRPPAGRALIVADGEWVGFVQWQRIGARELLESGVDVPDDETLDIDIFIADAGQLGRGIGSKAIEVLMKKLEEEGAAKRATLFTSVENERAKRAYEKAGFRKRSMYLDDEHGWTNVMMVEIGSRHQKT
jgi:ribosomal protein S18 acetylase RimI-like enzyme